MKQFKDLVFRDILYIFSPVYLEVKEVDCIRTKNNIIFSDDALAEHKIPLNEYGDCQLIVSGNDEHIFAGVDGLIKSLKGTKEKISASLNKIEDLIELYESKC